VKSAGQFTVGIALSALSFGISALSFFRLERRLFKRVKQRQTCWLNRAPESEMPATKSKGLEDLFHDTLKDIYYAERKILKALPKMMRAAQSPDLKAAFEKHKGETEGHVERLQQVFELIGKRAQGKTCDAIEGIIAEGEEIIEEFKDTPAIDAGLISAAQAVEHYEITRYGTLKRWAEVLGMNDAVKLLDATLGEESLTDKALTGLADASANEMAKAA
jgi:ferritin-like metal-binding protein YciE